MEQSYVHGVPMLRAVEVVLDDVRNRGNDSRAQEEAARDIVEVRKFLRRYDAMPREVERHLEEAENALTGRGTPEEARKHIASAVREYESAAATQ